MFSSTGHLTALAARRRLVDSEWHMKLRLEVKGSIFTCLGLSLLLRADTNSPALENSLSAGTDVLGIHKYFIAKSASWG